MTPVEGTPWRPQQLDEYLDDSFEQIEEMQHVRLLERLDEMSRRLYALEEELDGMVRQAAHYS